MKKILINIPEALLEKVDRRAREENMTRSEATREALRNWLRSGRYIAPLRRPGFAGIERRMRAASKRTTPSPAADVLIRNDREGR